MSKKILSDEKINILLINKYVKSIGQHDITYIYDFKKLFITESLSYPAV